MVMIKAEKIWDRYSTKKGRYSAGKIWNKYTDLLSKLKIEKTFSEKEMVEFEFLQEIIWNTIN
jgi:hypothetical protein